jgi:superoxide dismutase, Cu-Zn family
MTHRFILPAVFATTLGALGCERDDMDTPKLGARTGAIQGATGVTPAMSASSVAPLAITTGVTGAHHADHETSSIASGITPVGMGSVGGMGAGGTGAGVAGTSGGGASTAGHREAEAEFKSVPQMKIKGDAELDEVPGGVQVSIEVENALPGQKGIHIHQTDNCSDIANKSMGEHFAPTSPKHGLPGAREHHLGDLGNIEIDKDGKGKLEITVMGANLDPKDPMSFIGKSIVLHESNDKGTGPSGDSGKPIACAPIRAD